MNFYFAKNLIMAGGNDDIVNCTSFDKVLTFQVPCKILSTVIAIRIFSLFTFRRGNINDPEN